MSQLDTSLKLRHRRACTYKAVKPFLSKPIPAIALKYYTTPTPAQRKEQSKTLGITCDQCRNKIAVVGSHNTVTGLVTCDVCAIKNYRVFEGFKTIEAARAHRRRMFDVGYLLTEVLVDYCLESYGLEHVENLTEIEYSALVKKATDFQNMIPKSKKIELENTVDQDKIERYYKRLITRYLRLPKERLLN